ncbi:MAG: CdaR family protein [Chloroflexia bacterium]
MDDIRPEAATTLPLTEPAGPPADPSPLTSPARSILSAAKGRRAIPEPGVQTPRSKIQWEPATRLLMAFVIASLLWFYVLNSENPAASTTYPSVPVVPRGLDKNLSIINDLGTAAVSASAPQDVLSRLTGTDFNPTVDLTGRGPGTYSIPVQVSPPSNVAGVSVQPSQLQVQIVAVDERSFPVEVHTQGRPSIGYRLDTQQVSPPAVTVRGPRDLLSRVNQVAVEVNVEGKQGTQAGEVGPQALDFAGSPISGLQFSPQYVNVTITIQQLLNYKTLPIHVPIAGAPAPGFRITDILVQPTTLTAYGLPSVLEPLNFLETAPVSIGGVTQTLSVNITVPLTNGLTLYPPGTSGQVELRVAIEEISTETQIPVRVDLVGLASGLTGTASPAAIGVTLSGPLDALQGLKPESVRAVLDLSGYAPGTYKLVPVISQPPRTTLSRSDVSEVTVSIVSESTPIPAVSPSPTGLPPPVPTVVPTPRQLPTPTLRAEPSPRAIPTPTATASPIPTPTSTPLPSPTPAPSPTPQPASSPTPPASTPTATPGHTPTP